MNRKKKKVKKRKIQRKNRSDGGKDGREMCEKKIFPMLSFVNGVFIKSAEIKIHHLLLFLSEWDQFTFSVKIRSFF